MNVFDIARNNIEKNITRELIGQKWSETRTELRRKISQRIDEIIRANKEDNRWWPDLQHDQANVLKYLPMLFEMWHMLQDTELDEERFMNLTNQTNVSMSGISVFYKREEPTP